ncbi:hypothetical protein ACFV1T_16815, partial [Streptomyces vinaceus]
NGTCCWGVGGPPEEPAPGGGGAPRRRGGAGAPPRARGPRARRARAGVPAPRAPVAPTVRDIRILEPATAAAHLASAPATLKPPDTEALFTQARDARTWLSPLPHRPRSRSFTARKPRNGR